MIDDLKQAKSGGVRPRRWLAGGALVLGATTALACGNASDDPGSYKAAAASPPPASAANSPTDATPKTGSAGIRWNGRVRLGALRLGTPGKVTVSPKGTVPLAATHHWYKLGSTVTLTARDTRTAKFLAWGGTCHGKKRTCTIKMSDSKDAIASFGIDKKGAKGLKRSDKRLKFVVSD